MKEATDAASPEGKKLIEEHGVMNQDRKLVGSSEHIYRNMDKICSLSDPGCSAENVHNGVKRHPAPGADGMERIRTGSISNVDLPGPIPGTDHVLHHVDDKMMTVFNFTLGDHMLNPGWVMRQTMVINNDVYIQTYGEGSGFNVFNVNGNQDVVDYVWEGTNDHIRQCIAATNC